MHIYDRNHPFDDSLITEIGGKAYNLRKMEVLNPPKWFVITASFFNDWLGSKKDTINQLLQNPIKDNLNKIKDIVINTSFNDNFRSEVIKRINLKIKYAVRSSAVDEDSKFNSFAGVMDSYLNVDHQDIFDKIKLCYLSAFSLRAIEYRNANKLFNQDIGMAVIIQEMVDAEYAGVINTINPVTNNPDEVLISVIKGLGEDLVSGKVNSTDYYINGDNIIVEGSDILPRKYINKILKMTSYIMENSDTFQDIEFAIKGSRVFFLQTRAITTYASINIKNKKLVIDNSNIIESYSGVTTPLTFSFAMEVYHKVYTQTLKAGHVNQKIMDSLYPSLSNMLYFYDNKIYYNLNSWYHANSIFPNKKANSYMERMMGVNTKLTTVKKVKMNIVEIIRFGFLFLKRLNRMDKDSQIFIEKFNQVVMPYVGVSLEGKTNQELLEMYNSLEKAILNDFSTPIINDSGAMMYYGMLTKFVRKLKISDHEGYISYLVGKQGNVESALSAPLFLEIVKFIRKNEEVNNDFKSLNVEILYEKYHQNSKLTPLIYEYLKKFGPRVMDELKLETITLIENPIYLYEMLKNYIVNDIKMKSFAREDKPFRIHIPLLKRIYFRYLVKKTKYFIRNRERLRLKRTYIYSVVRNIFLQIGKNFYKSKIIEDQRDIFFLEKDEIFRILNGEIIYSIKDFINKRKDEYLNNQKKPTFNRIVFYGTSDLPIYTRAEKNNDMVLRGIPSGAGKVTGPIKYVENPKEALLKDEIMLALRTDPGWITLFPMCKGLIVERGSILSHSAVVAREMGIPAVVGVSGATSKLQDGMNVEVDGIKGEVRICE